MENNQISELREERIEALIETSAKRKLNDSEVEEIAGLLEEEKLKHFPYYLKVNHRVNGNCKSMIKSVAKAKIGETSLKDLTFVSNMLPVDGNLKRKVDFEAKKRLKDYSLSELKELNHLTIEGTILDNSLNKIILEKSK